MNTRENGTQARHTPTTMGEDEGGGGAGEDELDDDEDAMFCKVVWQTS